MKIEINNINWGYGDPGWNVNIRVKGEKGEERGYASWPNTNGPSATGCLREHLEELRQHLRPRGQYTEIEIASEAEAIVELRKLYPQRK